MKIDNLLDYILFPLKHKKKKWQTWVLLAMEGILFFLLAELGSDSYTNTILPFCINWNYYNVVFLIFLFIIYLSEKCIAKKEERLWLPIVEYMIIGALSCVLMLNLIFVPNRFISIENYISERGKVVDVDTYFFNKSASSKCFIVKIKLGGSNNAFWYNVGKEKIELNDSCKLITHVGIFRLKYVDNVVFKY